MSVLGDAVLSIANRDPPIHPGPPPDALSANAILQRIRGMNEIILYMDESRHPW